MVDWRSQRLGPMGVIEKVDRKNSLAHLEFHMGQMTIKTTVGLAVVPGSGHENRV